VLCLEPCYVLSRAEIGEWEHNVREHNEWEYGDREHSVWEHGEREHRSIDRVNKTRVAYGNITNDS
jgi:hypothetical protein